MTLRTTFTVLLCVVLFLGCGSNGDEAPDQEGEGTEQTPVAVSDRPLADVPPEARNNYYSSPPPMVIDENKRYTATIHTEKGSIRVELDAVAAPQHVNNFVFLARQGFYDGLSFHRVEPNFVIQDGDPTGTGRGGPGYRIPAEIGLPHQQGAVAMARKADQVNPERKSSGSQFYITLQPTPFLDGQYSVFGRVIQGFDVVQQIEVGDGIEYVEIHEE